MTRTLLDDFAIAALPEVQVRQSSSDPDRLVRIVFDLAEAMLAESQRRKGTDDKLVPTDLFPSAKSAWDKLTADLEAATKRAVHAEAVLKDLERTCDEIQAERDAFERHALRVGDHVVTTGVMPPKGDAADPGIVGVITGAGDAPGTFKIAQDGVPHFGAETPDYYPCELRHVEP